MNKITVKNTEIVFYKKDQEDYISLTDIAKIRDAENPSQIISLWLRTYSTIEYIGLWEMLNNPSFNPHIYEGFKNESAKPHFWMSPQKWISETNAIGMTSKSGRYGGGTYAHSDIAFKFAAWISAEFELYRYGVQTTENRGAKNAWLVCEARISKNQLPHSYRRH